MYYTLAFPASNQQLWLYKTWSILLFTSHLHCPALTHPWSTQVRAVTKPTSLCSALTHAHQPLPRHT